MRKILRTTACLLLSSAFLITHANTYTASTNGNWSSPATWGGAGVPTAGDIAVIPAGKSVTIDAGAGTLDPSYAVFYFNNPSRIQVSGTLNVVGNSSASGGVVFQNPINLEIFSGGVVNDNDVQGAFNFYETSSITTYAGGSFYVWQGGGPGNYNTWIFDLNVAPINAVPPANEPFLLGQDGTYYNGNNAFLPGPFTLTIRPSASLDNITFVETVLPVRFISFTALPAGNNVNLNWVVGVNQQAKTYEVDHSTDGVHFSVIGHIVNNPDQTSYSFVHTQAGTGTHYYRILETDADGKSIYSTVATAKISQRDFSVNVLNNPAASGTDAQLQINTVSAGTALIELWSVSGVRLGLQQRSVGAGASRVDLPMNNLPAGAYVVKVKLNNHTQVTRVVKR